MDEARRFLRYVLPGLAFFTQLGITLLITNRSGLIYLFHTYIKDVSGWAAAVSGFLVSGALGYLFSIIYFSVYWILPCLSDHATVINGLIKNRKLVQR